MKITDLYEEDKFLTNENDIIEWMGKSFVNFDTSYLIIKSDEIIYTGGLELRMRYPENELKAQFNSVTRDFYCNFTKITTLEGCPKNVGNIFNCSSTNITSLKFCPQSIKLNFHCYKTKIIDPKEYRWALYSEIGGRFDSAIKEIDDIINEYKGSANRKYWPNAINLLSKVEL